MSNNEALGALWVGLSPWFLDIENASMKCELQSNAVVTVWIKNIYTLLYNYAKPAEFFCTHNKMHLMPSTWLFYFFPNPPSNSWDTNLNTVKAGTLCFLTHFHNRIHIWIHIHVKCTLVSVSIYLSMKTRIFQLYLVRFNVTGSVCLLIAQLIPCPIQNFFNFSNPPRGCWDMIFHRIPKDIMHFQLIRISMPTSFLL